MTKHNTKQYYGRFIEFLNSKGVENFQLYKFGRVALREGLRFLNVKSILIPSYICSVIIPEIQKLGCAIQYYNINRDLLIDFEDLATKRADAVLVVDYFGFPADIERVREVIDIKTYIVEDNAHGFLSEENGWLLGTRGDIGIASLRKTFPIIDGAILYCPKGYGMDVHIEKAMTLSDYKNKAFFSFGKYIDRRVKYVMNRVIPDKWEGWISNESFEIINKIDYECIKAIERKNYFHYLNIFREAGDVDDVEVLFRELKEGICPWVFPFISTKKRQVATNWANRDDVWILPLDKGIKECLKGIG